MQEGLRSFYIHDKVYRSSGLQSARVCAFAATHFLMPFNTLYARYVRPSIDRPIPGIIQVIP